MTHSNFSADYKPTLSQPVVLRMGVSAQIITGNWDLVSTDGYNILEYYKKSSLEPLLWLPDDSRDPKSQLATSWEYEYRSEGFTNSLGFNNSGGIKAINITLRNGVQFQDGSNWNATVAKWNIDRLYLISGNLTGNANGIYDQRNTATWWDPYQYWDRLFTADWNLSEYEGVYSYYYIGDPSNPVNKVENPSPYGGIDPWGNPIHYTPFNQIPMVKWVEIVESLPSGGKIRVEFNSWGEIEMHQIVSTPQISYHAYHQDYTDTGIYGYDNSDPGPDHIIGTGPYIFQEHDEIADRGYMLKNENYWNKTALEADGWFDADQVELVQFPPGELGEDARNIALLCHVIDYAFDSMTMRIDYDAVMADPNINYYEDHVSEYQTQITLNSINETWWSGGVAKEFNTWGFEPYGKWNYSTNDLILGMSPAIDISDISLWYPNERGKAAGIPRVMRKALSYAFDYDTLINVDLNGRAERCGGVVGIANVYYNSSIPLADYNLTHARKVLLEHDGTDQWSLTQPWWPCNFSQMLKDRGITASSTDAQWHEIADHTSGNYDPIMVLNFYWDDVHQELADTFERAANNLGVALVQDFDNKLPQGKIIWDTVGAYWALNFDGVSSIWSASAWPMDYYMPKTIPEGWIAAHYGDPDKGSWRTGYYPVGSSPAFWPTWNFGFNYDTEIDTWINCMYVSDSTRKQEYISKIANKEQNELYPMIYAYQQKEGRVLWNTWKMNLNRGPLFFANFDYLETPSAPGDFVLSSDAGTPDIDGNFNLIWDVSIGADNYSIYRYGSEITEINGSLTSISYQTASSPFPIAGLTDGEYYFVVVAYNQYGDTLSNNIHITVQIAQTPPESFLLSTDADFPDDDGIFNLGWTTSNGADNYSLYMHNTPITVIDSSLTLLVDQTAMSPFSVSGLPNGSYYFVVVAHNQYGDTLSNNIFVTVSISTSPEISGYNTIILMGIAIITTVILLNRKKKKTN